MGDVATDVAGHGRRLAESVDAALGRWVVSAIERVAATAGRSVDPTLRTAAERAGEQARAEVGARLAGLLALDVDQQSTTPLSILREAAAYPTRVLVDAGVPAVRRDREAEARFPDDVYDLTPAAFADFGPQVAEAGLTWGAAKAFEHKRRHRG